MILKETMDALSDIKVKRVSLPTAARAGAVVVTALTMALLYYGLYGLAREVGYAKWQAALFPAPIDGVVLVAYLAAYSFKSGHRRAYAWFVVLVAAGASAIGQYLHTKSLVGTQIPGAIPGSLVPDWAPWIAVMPAIASPLALHISIMLSRQDKEEPRVSRLRKKTAARLETRIDELLSAVAYQRETLDSFMGGHTEFVKMMTDDGNATFAAVEDLRHDLTQLREHIESEPAPVDVPDFEALTAAADAIAPEVPAAVEAPASAPVRKLPRGHVPDDAREIIEKWIRGEVLHQEVAKWIIAEGYTKSQDIVNARKMATRWKVRIEKEGVSDASRSAE